MDLIFYSEAANLLGVKMDTLRHAVSRGELTKAGHNGRNVCLIREQVMLFKGRRLSKDTLNTAKTLEWERYAREARQVQSPSAAVDEEAINRMIEQKVKAQFLQQEAARLRREEEAARAKRERLEQENPFLMAVSA